MANLLRALRPARSEVKKLIGAPPEAQEDFDDDDARDEYVKGTKLFIRNLTQARQSMQNYFDKLVVMDFEKQADQAAVEAVVDADTLILLDAGKCIEKYANHVEAIETQIAYERNAEQLAAAQAAQPAPVQVDAAPARNHTVKLPKLEMKKFSGEVTRWAEWWDAYDAAVHQNHSIVPVQKFTYLKSMIVGEASKAISGLALTTENYDVAVDILKNRFGDTQVIINAHYAAFNALQPAFESTSAIRQVYDALEKHLRSLEALGQDVTHQQFISMILGKLPKAFRLRLEESRGADAWTVESVRKRIQQLLTAREITEQHEKPASTTSKNEHQKKNFHNTTSSLMAGSEEKRAGKTCIFCTKHHWSDECRTFATIEARKQQIKGRCFVCLQKSHSYKDCTSDRTCTHCGQTKNHHRSLCPKKFSHGGPSGGNSSSKQSRKADPKSKQPKSESSCTVGEAERNSAMAAKAEAQTTTENAFINADERGVLQTAWAWVAPANSKSKEGSKVRLVLDCGSQRTYVTSDLAKKLKAKPVAKETLLVYPFGATEAKRIETDIVKLDLKLLDGTQFQFTAHTVATIGDVHHAPIEVDKFGPLFKTMPLADPGRKDEASNRTIDILIGNNFYWDLVTSEKIELKKGLYLIGTKLGWTVSGRMGQISNWKSKPSAVMMTQVTSDPTQRGPYVEADVSLLNEASIQDLWNIEAIGIREPTQDPSDEVALAKFNETIQYDGERYYVTFPWKDNVIALPDNRALALGCLGSQLCRFGVNRELLVKYDEIIRSQERDDKIEEVTEDMEDPTTKKHYLPHHPVITPERDTTKVRIVYNGSAKSSKSCPSLNECLHRGPVILDDICALLMRFRFHDAALIADIEKAFLQVGLQERERDVTRFFWLKDPTKLTLDNNVKIYRFKRVPFGIISSPFLLGATLMHHLSKSNNPTALRIKKDIYVDNLLSGAPSTETAKAFYQEAKSLLNAAAMNLREWQSNDKDVMQAIPEEDRMKKSIAKVLGMQWDTTNDTLSLAHTIKPPDIVANTPVLITKRKVLQSIARLFDPMGLWSPTAVNAKSFLQTLWAESRDWDAPIDQEKVHIWLTLLKELSVLRAETIPRRVIGTTINGDAKYELHCFTDASKRAYGACIYIRINNGSETKSTLLMSKSRVAPTRKITLPRLELLAATIGGRLLTFTEKALEVPIKAKYLWTDSQCVIHWIRSEKPLSVFVTNRVNELRSLKDTEFRYVPTDQNPADLASRGTTVGELHDNSLWWTGPGWLSTPQANWPSSASEQLRIDGPTLEKITSEEKKTILYDASLIVGAPADSPFGIDQNRFSSLSRLLRVTAWCNRFCSNLKARIRKGTDIKPGIAHSATKDLSAQEIAEAKRIWVLHVQRTQFTEVFDAITEKKRNPLQIQLGLWIDEQGILRCTGRLTQADLDDNTTFPILLPKKVWFTRLLIQSYHQKLFHSGVAHTLSQIRREFWIISGRSEVQRVLHSCLKCRRIEGGPYQPPSMPALPKGRVTESPPFTYTGLDYLGPLYAKVNDGEKKVWICLYTCMSTRAVHLELVEDLTAEQFLMSLRRFISRRGAPSFILSDNAKHFKRTKTAIDELWSSVTRDERVTSYISQNGIKWTFIPERAPWMGGLYERLVQSVKRALRKSIQNVRLTAIQLETILTEIESMLNTRPLTYVGSDINDRNALTPAHFLTLNPKIGIPARSDEDPTDPDHIAKLSSKEVLLRTWSKGEKHLQAFWKSWKDEYLLNLRERTQSQLKHPKATVSRQPAVGDVVHVKTESTRGSWPIARIEKLITSQDGAIRAAEVRLASGKMLTRAMMHLYPMELERDTHSTTVTPSGTTNATPATMAEPTRPERKPAKIADPKDDDTSGEDANAKSSTRRRSKRKAAKIAQQKIKAQAATSDEDSSAEVPTVALLLGGKKCQKIPVQVNGYPATALLDTGSETTILNQSFVDSWGPWTSGPMYGNDGSVVGISNQRIPIDGLRFVSIKLTDQAAPLPPKNVEAAILPNLPVDVIIGWDVLKQFKTLTIDGKTSQVTPNESIPKGQRRQRSVSPSYQIPKRICGVSVGSTMTALLVLTLVWLPIASGLQPLLCEKGNAKITLNLKGSYECNARTTIDESEKVFHATATLYKRNIAKFDSTAFKCSKVKTIVDAYTNFANAGWEQRQREESVPVSETECWSMIQTKRCREGALLGGEDVSFTENHADAPYTNGGTYCCKWYSKETTNCFVQRGKVFQVYNGQMESNLANVGGCSYEKGACELHDSSYLVWKKNESASCEFVAWKTTTGKAWGNRFLSNDNELAFTWEEGRKVELCDRNEAKLTDQGPPIVISGMSVITADERRARPKRESNNGETANDAASDELAPRLEALELRLDSFLKESLNSAFLSVCRAIKELQQVSLLLAHSEPTLIARKIMNDSNIMARLHGTVLEVWPCNPIQTFAFLAMETKCTEYLPLNYTVHEHTLAGYMDPVTRIIYAHSAPTECDTAQETHMTDDNGEIFIYTAHSGQLRKFEGHMAQHTLYTAEMTTNIDYKPVIHKPVIMYTTKERRGQTSSNEIFAEIEQHRTILRELAHAVDTPTSSKANAILDAQSRWTPLGLMDMFTSKLHWAWQQCCNGYVTFLMLWPLVRYLIRKAMNRQGTAVIAVTDPAPSNPIIVPHSKPQSVGSPILAAIEAMKDDED